MGWVVDTSRENNNIIGIGFDEGSVIVRIGSDDPVVSLSNGKVLWAKSMEILIANLKAIDLS
jgi:coatomer subunit beta'